MRHWFVQDVNGKTIGNLSLNDDSEIPALVVKGQRFELGAGFLEGSNSPQFFTIVPEPKMPRPPVVIKADPDLLFKHRGG